MTHVHKVSLKTAQRKDFKEFENGHLFLMGGIDPTKESANPEVLTTEVSHKNSYVIDFESSIY